MPGSAKRGAKRGDSEAPAPKRKRRSRFDKELPAPAAKSAPAVAAAAAAAAAAASIQAKILAQIASVQANLAAAQQRAGAAAANAAGGQDRGQDRGQRSGGAAAAAGQRGGQSGGYQQHRLVLNEAGEAVDSSGRVVRVKAVSTLKVNEKGGAAAVTNPYLAHTVEDGAAAASAAGPVDERIKVANRASRAENAFKFVERGTYEKWGSAIRAREVRDAYNASEKSDGRRHFRQLVDSAAADSGAAADGVPEAKVGFSAAAAAARADALPPLPLEPDPSVTLTLTLTASAPGARPVRNTDPNANRRCSWSLTHPPAISTCNARALATRLLRLSDKGAIYHGCDSGRSAPLMRACARQLQTIPYQ